MVNLRRTLVISVFERNRAAPSSCLIASVALDYLRLVHTASENSWAGQKRATEFVEACRAALGAVQGLEMLMQAMQMQAMQSKVLGVIDHGNVHSLTCCSRT